VAPQTKFQGHARCSALASQFKVSKRHVLRCSGTHAGRRPFQKVWLVSHLVLHLSSRCRWVAMMRRMFLARVCSTLGLHKRGQCCGQRVRRKRRDCTCAACQTRGACANLCENPRNCSRIQKPTKFPGGVWSRPIQETTWRVPNPPWKFRLFFCIAPNFVGFWVFCVKESGVPKQLHFGSPGRP